MGEVRDWRGCKRDVLHDHVRHLIVSVEEMKDLGNAWCAHVELCALEDVSPRLKFRPQRIVAVEFDEGSFDDYAASVVIFTPVITLVFFASADDGVLKGG